MTGCGRWLMCQRGPLEPPHSHVCLILPPFTVESEVWQIIPPIMRLSSRYTPLPSLSLEKKRKSKGTKESKRRKSKLDFNLQQSWISLFPFRAMHCLIDNIPLHINPHTCRLKLNLKENCELNIAELSQYTGIKCVCHFYLFTSPY